jgi:putative NIF3 family GTP cyclohydrolase 1 type 2
LGAIQRRIAIYSPHTALDATIGGVNDWLARGLGPARISTIAPTALPADAARPRSSKRASKVEPPLVGHGRLVVLNRGAELRALLMRLKRHLKLAHLRVASSERHQNRGRGRPAEPIRRIALCAGAGGSIVTRSSADLYLTGEMRHHDVLGLVESGASVVLTEHTNSERGYLPTFARRLRESSQRRLSVSVSEVDSDPLVIR